MWEGKDTPKASLQLLDCSSWALYPTVYNTLKIVQPFGDQYMSLIRDILSSKHSNGTVNAIAVIVLGKER